MDNQITGMILLKQAERVLHLRRGAGLFISWGFFLLLVNSSLASTALAGDLLIIYPEAPPPYSKVFEDMIKGVSSQYTGTIHRLQTSSFSDAPSIRDRLEHTRPDIILALGSKNVGMLATMNITTPIVAGALRAKPANNTSGISIFPDPVVVMEKLLLLSPTTNNVFVVTASTSENSYLEEAQIYMDDLGKQLVIHRVAGIHDAASRYLQVSKSAKEYDGIWILPGETAIDNALMTQLLQTAWDKNIVLFSSNPNDVRKGTLFAVYPDNEKMGQDLGVLVNKQLAGDISEPHFSPVKRLLLAVNVRTSRHLGLALSGRIRSDIHLEL